MDILIVEDEILLGLLLAEALADAGHRALGPASCRTEALDLAAANPQLALVDIELRDGESGIELAKELARRGVPCLFATAQPEKARQHRTAALGLIAKPCSPAALIEAVRYVEALLAGERPAARPRGLELFASDVSAPESRLAPGAPALIPLLSGSPPPAPRPAVSERSAAPIEPPLADAGVLEALTG